MAIGGIDSYANLLPANLRSALNGPTGSKLEDVPSVSDADAGLSSGSTLGSGNSFGQAFKDAIGQVNTLQGNADTLSQKLATGDVQDVHQVMLALNQASNAFGLTVQVRNKAIDAYQEIMRMQV